MALYAARDPNHPPTSKPERDRIRELSKYYCTFTYPDAEERAAPTGDEQPGEAYLSPDITLNALGQLGVHRFGCNRSFISIIDGGNQHIIAEMTKSVSLRHTQQHLPSDGIYLGFRTLDLAWGVCPHTIKLFTADDSVFEIDTPNITANRSRYIIRNFAAEECFADRPYVVEWPHMRFYAEVPLFSPSGHVLGSYCVLDDQPRDQFGDTEVALLQEIADAIAHYLESTRVVHFHRRAEKLVKGVTDLVTGRPEPEAVPAAGPTVHFHWHGKSDNGDLPLPALKQTSSLSTDFSSSLSVDKGTTHCTETSSSSLQDEIWSATPHDNEAHFRPGPNASLDISQSIASVFSQASEILRDSMELDGVLFVDAYQSNFGINSPKSPGGWRPSPKSLHGDIVDSLGSIQLGLKHDENQPEEAQNLCETFGQALKSDTGREVVLTEDLLEKMITAFPQGQVFVLGDRPINSQYLSYQSDGAAELQDLHNITAELAKQLPEADSVVFFPLWDWNKQRWLAGTLLWMTKMQRALGLEELGFFKAFSNSIISEVARIDWNNSEKSKSNFISSISHELRTPLHGILGNAELLRSSALEPAQVEMIKMIEVCGSTLLDVVNHLLDYTKINSMTKADFQRANDQNADSSSLITEFELDELLEEVTEIMYMSHQRKGKKPPTLEAEGPFHSSARYDSTATEPLSIVVRVEDQNAWKVASVAGAWRRIVMCLLGNSLKWTKQGLIEVSLSSIRTGGSDPVLAHLSVTDTGTGISSDYLRHSVFSPFSQEDSLSEGVGLGLNLVRKLVSFLGGYIDVKSELGVGTQVDAYIPVQYSSNETADPDEELPNSMPATRACLVGFNDWPDLNESPTGILSPDTKRKLSIQRSLSNCFLAEPNWSVSSGDCLENADGDIVVIEDMKLQQLVQADSIASAQPGIGLVIVLGEEKCAAENQASPKFVHLSHPFGPRKIVTAIRSAMKDLRVSVIHPVPQLGTVLPETPITPQPVINEGSGMHILIVDDNNINLKILSTFLRKLECSYETASNGLIALNKYMEAQTQFTHVLMDLSMPVMDGLDSTRKIRSFEIETGLPRSCIMAVTGVASAEMQQQATMVGLNDYLVKPVSLKRLKKALGVT
ncbi:hypothetical protein BJX70DRAFT_390283 [Aspergillus crustosus]